MEKFKKYYKNNKKKTIGGGIILALILLYIFTRGGEEIVRDVVGVQYGTVLQEIDVTGRVVAARDLKLAVTSGGKVSAIPVLVGQTVQAGETILRVDSSDLYITLGRRQAALEKAKLALLKAQPTSKGEDDLKTAYEDGFTAATDAFTTLPTVIEDMDTVFSASYLSENTLRSSYGERTRDLRVTYDGLYYKADKAFRELSKKYKTTTRDQDKETIEAMIRESYVTSVLVSDMVKAGRNVLQSVSVESDGELDQLTTDTQSVGAYSTSVNSIARALLASENEIKASKEGVTNEDYDITSLQISVRQAELDVEDTLVEIGKRTIKAPVAGLVTNISAEVGETVASGAPIVSIISQGQFQIEVNIPEADIAKVRIGDTANINLDAYGSDVVFIATVVLIDPAETVLDGVATYKTTLQFKDTDERIRSGMTADITILGERKENVLSVPIRAVSSKDGNKYVQVLVGEEVIEKKVVTGLRGSEGNIEILEGLTEGEQVIVFTAK